jgi:hypothetical protein
MRLIEGRATSNPQHRKTPQLRGEVNERHIAITDQGAGAVDETSSGR